MSALENGMKERTTPPMQIRFLCLARNCEKTIPRFFAYMTRLEETGLHCSALIGENGSTDATRQLLDAAAGARVAVLDTGFMSSAPGRLTRMAIGRQALLDRSRSEQTHEFVVVADLDNVMTAPPNPATVKATVERLQSDETLFAAGATSYPFYYDLLSLQAEGHDYRTLNKEITDAKRHPARYFQFHQRRIYDRQIEVSRSGLVNCSSSFNGFCIYRAADYYLGSYRAEDEADVCEHVSLNLSIAKATGKRMVIAHDLSLQMPADHAPVTFFRFWADRVRKALPQRS